MSKKVMLIALSIALVAALVGGATMAWFTDGDVSEPVTFAAGTVMIEAGSSSIASQYFDSRDGVFLYGVEGGTGDIYEINVMEGVAPEARLNKIFTTDPHSGDFAHNYPNGLAFDDVNDRLYYVKNKQHLYFYDFSTGVEEYSMFIKDLGHIMNATFGDGDYWYIPSNTADLYRITFNPDGTWKERIGPMKVKPSGGFEFGDIALHYKDGIIYGSSTNLLFTYDPAIGPASYKEHARGSDWWLQIAFGSDDVLYGHSGHAPSQGGTGDWFKIDFDEDGNASKSYLFKTDILFMDLACGHTSVWNPGDCAYAKFNVKNVGTKNSYVRLDLSGHWQGYVDGTGWVDDPALSTDVVSFTATSANWTEEGGYYYYQNSLAPGGTAELQLQVCLDGPETGNDYQGKRFVLTGAFDAIQTTHGASQELWGWSPTE